LQDLRPLLALLVRSKIFNSIKVEISTQPLCTYGKQRVQQTDG
jgi:hypothetical protein